MRVLLQRVSRARVTVAGEITGSIGPGALLFVGIHATDGEAELAWMARKCAQLRIFEDDDGKMNRSLLDIQGDALVVSQFTLYGDVQKGNRPSFIAAASPDHARPMVDRFTELLGIELGRPIAAGRFGAMMDVELINDGPVTLWLERKHAD